MNVNKNYRSITMLLLGGSFVALAVLVWNGKTDALDMTFRNWTLGFNTPTSVALWEYVSLMGSAVVLSGFSFLAIGFFILHHDWHTARRIAFAMGGAVVLDTISKWVVHRPRPEEIYAHTLPASYSFPSGHALHSFTFYILLAFVSTRHTGLNLTRAIWSAAVAISVLIGMSRIFLGVHYGSDVLGGYLIAAAWLVFVMKPTAANKIDPTSPNKKDATKKAASS